LRVARARLRVSVQAACMDARGCARGACVCARYARSGSTGSHWEYREYWECWEYRGYWEYWESRRQRRARRAWPRGGRMYAETVPTREAAHR
jgi:hypothetical protein